MSTYNCMHALNACTKCAKIRGSYTGISGFKLHPFRPGKNGSLPESSIHQKIKFDSTSIPSWLLNSNSNMSHQALIPEKYEFFLTFFLIS